jgi:riboflavin synthase
MDITFMVSMTLMMMTLMMSSVVIVVVTGFSFDGHKSILPSIQPYSQPRALLPVLLQQRTPLPLSSSSSSSTATTNVRRNMFTGIVEDMGTIIALEQRNDIVPFWNDGTGGSSTGTGTDTDTQSNHETTTNTTVMTIQTSEIILSDPQSAYLGCSICVSGVCLTATHIDFQQKQFTVTLAPETLRKTYFGHIVPSDQLLGRRVNLERAAVMSVSSGSTNSRNSGHYVQGHVDDVGTIVDRQTDNDSIVYTIQVPIELMSYIVPKGFIAIDGTSLTVIDTNPINSTFTFMLIPYTQQHIIIPSKQVGDLVNVEVDILSKYAMNNNNNNSNNSNASINLVVSKLQEQINALEERVQVLETALNAVTSKV